MLVCFTFPFLSLRKFCDSLHFCSLCIHTANIQWAAFIFKAQCTMIVMWTKSDSA